VKKKRISILGSTGSIGVNTLNVIREFPDLFEVIGLSAGTNFELLRDQIKEFNPKIAAISSSSNVEILQDSISPRTTKLISGEKGLVEVAIHPDVDIVVSAVVGSVGLKPLIESIDNGKNIALANKESMVMAGELIQEKSREKGVMILPVDSEHNAIFQCLRGKASEDIEKIILTASGGPFRNLPLENMDSIKPQDALKHPTWDMGAKITTDSATLMNKGLELIEAKWFFDVDRRKLDVVIHPESIIHSMVQFKNRSTIAQMGLPDMKHPISYALAYPDTLESNLPALNLPDIGSLSFFEPDYEKFPCLSIAFDALDFDNSFAITLNAANEVAVQLFLEEKISFSMIPGLIKKVLDKCDIKKIRDVDEIIEFDLLVRDRTMKLNEIKAFQT